MIEQLNAIYPVIAAIITASYLYVAKATGSTPESFDLTKWLSTVIIGAGITVILIVTGTDATAITTDNVGLQLMAYSGLIVFVEKGLKIVIGTIRLNITAISRFLPSASVPATSAASASVVDPVNSGTNGSSASVVSDSLDKIAVKSYPAILQGVSPFVAQYVVACDPASGVHAAVKAIVDHGDGSAVEEIAVVNGIAHVNHTYEYVQGRTLVDNAPSQYYARVFLPKISVVGRDGLRGGMNDDLIGDDGKREISLTIEVKDAAAVAAGKVTNFPAPAH